MRWREHEPALNRLPYPAGVRLLRQPGVAWLRRLGGDDRWLAFCRSHLARAAWDERTVLRRRLLTTELGISRLRELHRSRWPEGGSRWFTATGREHLDAARAGGRKVVLVNSHYGAVQCAPLLVHRLGFRLHSVECCDPFAALGLAPPAGLAVIPTSQAFLPRVAIEAARTLASEGLVCLAADGCVGLSGQPLPFLGRARRFPRGFAELAVGAGAAVVPILARIDDAGRTTLELGRAFPDPDPALPRGERVQALVGAYARWLEARWTEDPGNIFNLERFFALPPWPAA